MQDLKNKTIGGKSVTLKKVPASKARKIQTLLIASAATPLAEAFSQELPETKDKKVKNKESVKAVLNGISGVITNLKDGELDELIELSSPFILVNGEKFSEDDHFDADTLFVMYEVLWFFLKETFGNFIEDLLSRLTGAKNILKDLSL